MKSKTIGTFRITDKKIGEGAFGTVYVGIDTGNHNREVAVKVIEHSRLQGDALDYFYEQILAMKTCINEHIVKLFDIKKTENHFYVFLEYCEEGDLQKYIRKKGRLSQEEAMRFFWEIVRAFRTIVKAKRIHRDLKPANVFIKDGHIKIGDFGLAKILSQRDMTSTFAGSPYNMAPEVLGRQKYDSRADIYGIGTVLYEMLYGCPPFKASTVPELIEQINFRRYRKFDKQLVSEETLNLLTKMLKPDPNSRIGWQELFSLESKTRERGNSKLYKLYEELVNRADLKHMNAVPSIFCLLNTSNQPLSRNSSLCETSATNTSTTTVVSEPPPEKETQYSDIEMLDSKLSTQLFISLVQMTEVIESVVEY